eukprot:GHVT01069236.1.p1 GENE.GHVT01069236.1~~GHVT01069236.1.p1  ORF type:complete len:147 (+),score=2.48 GHVT01069236.1:615-1055(+)
MNIRTKVAEINDIAVRFPWGKFLICRIHIFNPWKKRQQWERRVPYEIPLALLTIKHLRAKQITVLQVSFEFNVRRCGRNQKSPDNKMRVENVGQIATLGCAGRNSLFALSPRLKVVLPVLLAEFCKWCVGYFCGKSCRVLPRRYDA